MLREEQTRKSVMKKKKLKPLQFYTHQRRSCMNHVLLIFVLCLFSPRDFITSTDTFGGDKSRKTSCSSSSSDQCSGASEKLFKSTLRPKKSSIKCAHNREIAILSKQRGEPSWITARSDDAESAADKRHFSPLFLSPLPACHFPYFAP